MRGGFRQVVPVATTESDAELVERTRRFRRAFNEFYRNRPSVEDALAYATAIAAVTGSEDGNVIQLPVGLDRPEWGDAA